MKNKKQQYQSFSYENQCKCYKKLASGLWSMLFTLTYFFHTLSSSTAKQNVVTITVFLSKLDHQMLFNYIYQENQETILL